MTAKNCAVPCTCNTIREEVDGFYTTALRGEQCDYCEASDRALDAAEAWHLAHEPA